LICAPTEVGGGFSLSAAPQFWQKYAPVCTAAWHDGHIKISWLSIIHHTSYHVIDLDGPLCECGARGDLESLISGTAFNKRFGKNAEDRQSIAIQIATRHDSLHFRSGN
jgi:hypothetical protein